MTESTAQPTPSAPGDSGADSLVFQRYLQNIRDNQNVMLGILGGAAGALLGAVVWAIVAAYAHLNIGFIAILVGFSAGYGVRYLGKGIDRQFGIVGAVCAAVGVAAGNILATSIATANHYNTKVLSVIGSLNLDIMKEMLIADFSPIDLFFYGIALWAGYKYAIRIVKPEDAKSFTGSPVAR